MPSFPVLVLNSGSSSIKFSLYETGDGARSPMVEGAVDGIGTDQGEFRVTDSAGRRLADETRTVATLAVAFQLVAEVLHTGDLAAPRAIGHRMVSGGPTVQENQLITPALIDEMERYTAFAPLHTPIAVYIMREALRLFPGVPEFVVLDTYFHRTMPEVARRLPIPSEYAQMGVQRYGAHGISYESIVLQLEPDVPERLIVAHLGNGASISAIRGGRCLDTSMGLTPTGGLISGTRTGDIDPGVLLFILREIARKSPKAQAAADELEAVVAKKAGLLGVSGLSNDMRDLREAIGKGDARARLAVDLFVRTIQRWIGSYFVELGGLDMLVLTGGIGENDGATRAEICAGLGALGVEIDPGRNDSRGAARISSDRSRVAVRVIPPAEDLIIVNHVLRLLDGSPS